MKVVVTGATGFVGRHLLDRLEVEGHQILAVARDDQLDTAKVKWLKCDLTNLQEYARDIAAFKPEYIYHLAWQGIPDFSNELCELNVEIGRELITSASSIESLRGIVVAGSCWEYGDNHGVCDESLVAYNLNNLAQAKTTLLEHLTSTCLKHQKHWYWSRIFYLYGPGQRAGSLIPSIISSLREGLIPEIKSPYSKHDFLFIEDLSHGLASFSKPGVPSGIYNFGSGHLTSVFDVLLEIEMQINGSNAFSQRMVSLGLQGEDSHGIYADIKKACSVLNFRPSTDLSIGISRTLGDHGSWFGK